MKKQAKKKPVKKEAKAEQPLMTVETPTSKKIEIDVDQTTQNAINLAFVAGLVIGIIVGVMI